MKFTDLLDQYNISYMTEGHHHCRQGWVQLNCPFCANPSSDKWHLGYHLQYGYCNCWVCGPHYIGHVVSELFGITIHEAKCVLEGVERVSFKQIKVTGKLKLPTGLSSLRTIHRKYLKKRGFNPKELRQFWALQGTGKQSDYPWRIFIPIIYQGKTVSWTSRTIGNGDPKYITASKENESLFHKTLLYGEDFCRHVIIVVEGPVDVWRIGPGAAGSFGVRLSSEQIEKVSKYPVRVICFDNEKEAQKQASILCSTLSLFPGETYNVVVDEDDPGSMSVANVNKLRKKFF